MKNTQTGEVPGRIEFFQLTRFSAKKSTWVGENAKNAYDQMTQFQTQPSIEESSPMTEDHIYEQVLGPPRKGYILGLGAGPKPKPSPTSAQHYHAQVEEATRRADEANQMAEDAERHSTRLFEELDALRNKTEQMEMMLREVMMRLPTQGNMIALNS